MGAFAELLIKHFGGNITNTSTVVDNIDSTVKVNYAVCDYKLAKARRMLYSITSGLMYRPQNAQLYTEASIKHGFKMYGFDDNIQNVMWLEYCAFVADYVKSPDNAHSALR